MSVSFFSSRWFYFPKFLRRKASICYYSLKKKKRKKELYLKESVCDFQRTANCIFPLKGRGGKAQQDLGPLCRSSFSHQVPVAQGVESTIYWIPQYSRFSRHVTAAMLVYRTIAKKVLWDFDSIIMQNLSAIVLYMAVSSRE